MKNAKEEILLAKMKSKLGKQPSAITGTVNPHNSTNAIQSNAQPSAMTGGNGMGPSAMTGGNGYMPTAMSGSLVDDLRAVKLQEKLAKPKIVGEVDFGPTETQHSPIKEYMKKKGK